MQIIGSGSYKGIGKYNNDILNHIGNMYYVIDGASALFNDNLFFKTSDLYEYMQLLKENIKDDDTIINNLKEGIINSNKLIQNIENYDEYKLPTFTIAAMKEYDDYVEVYLLCDCLISILYKNGDIENIEDHRYDKIKLECRNKIKKIDKMQLSLDEKINLKRPIWQEYRKFANIKHGYPVGSTDKNSVDRGIVKKINKKIINKILICTDGFYSEFGLPKDKDNFDSILLEKKIKKAKNKDDLTYILIGDK